MHRCQQKFDPFWLFYETYIKKSSFSSVFHIKPLCSFPPFTENMHFRSVAVSLLCVRDMYMRWTHSLFLTLQISVWRAVPAHHSGLQAGKNLYTIGLSRFVTAQKMLLFCILHFAFCISCVSTKRPNLSPNGFSSYFRIAFMRPIVYSKGVRTQLHYI